MIKILRNIYSNFKSRNNQIHLFDSNRQRAYFQRTNQRLQTKIKLDIQTEQVQQSRTIQVHLFIQNNHPNICLFIKEQINIMRQISSYCLKIVQVERILSDLDIVSNIAKKINATTSNQIIDALKIEQGSDFIQQKQFQFNSILNKQQKRIQLLKDLIQKFEQQTSDQSVKSPIYYE